MRIMLMYNKYSKCILYSVYVEHPTVPNYKTLLHLD